MSQKESYESILLWTSCECVWILLSGKSLEGTVHWRVSWILGAELKSSWVLGSWQPWNLETFFFSLWC